MRASRCSARITSRRRAATVGAGRAAPPAPPPPPHPPRPPARRAAAALIDLAAAAPPPLAPPAVMGDGRLFGFLGQPAPAAATPAAPRRRRRRRRSPRRRRRPATVPAARSNAGRVLDQRRLGRLRRFCGAGRLRAAQRHRRRHRCRRLRRCRSTRCRRMRGSGGEWDDAEDGAAADDGDGFGGQNSRLRSSRLPRGGSGLGAAAAALTLGGGAALSGGSRPTRGSVGSPTDGRPALPPPTRWRTPQPRRRRRRRRRRGRAAGQPVRRRSAAWRRRSPRRCSRPRRSSRWSRRQWPMGGGRRPTAAPPRPAMPLGADFVAGGARRRCRRPTASGPGDPGYAGGAEEVVS